MQTALLFPGQGSQVVGMGRDFYENSPQVRHYFDQADRLLPFSLSKICFDGPEATLTETRVCQPALYVLGYAIASSLKENKHFIDSHKITCACGFSLGELTALAVAEVFDFETGLHLVYERGRLMQEACDAAPSGMLSLIGGTRETVEEVCQSMDLDMSNINCPGQIVVSGPLETLQALQEKARDLGFKLAVPLKVAGAYHSRWMKPAREAFEKVLEGVSFKAPKVTVLTNTTGGLITDPEAIKTALGKQITSTVQWESCLRYLEGKQLFYGLECGPGNVLAGLARRTSPSFQIQSLATWAQMEALLA